ncbi:putative transmembrane protein [Senna tora]|uniref:Putative transmembrane protein n=1 Tax=Senna tora TaxID=362788 RepID=A0A834U1R5_9FABA|nr:putative transmembrane protein [Senna tora]
MGRRIPDDNLPLILHIHPVLYLWLVGAGVAASIAIITSLCSVLFWKKPSASISDTSSPEESKKELDADSSKEGITLTSPPDPPTEDAEGVTTKELPLPPAMLQPKEPHVPPINMKRAASERGMSFNLSIKLPRTLSVARHQKEEMIKKKKGGKTEEVWMKTIILGEKCQVPADEEDAVIYEGKGKKVSAYHPKTRSTMSSSQINFVDADDNSLHAPSPPPPPPPSQQKPDQ